MTFIQLPVGQSDRRHLAKYYINSTNRFIIFIYSRISLTAEWTSWYGPVPPYMEPVTVSGTCYQSKIVIRPKRKPQAVE